MSKKYVFLIILILVFIVVGYFIVRSKQEVNEQNLSPAPATQNINETEGNQTSQPKFRGEEGKAVDISDISEEVRQQVIDDREERLAKKLEEMRHRKRQLVDPIQFEMSIRDEKLLNYEPAFGDELNAVTPSQKKKLEKMGIFSEDIQNKGLAESLIKKLDERRIGGFTTPKQIRCLERYGFRDVGTWKFLFAKSLIDRIAGNRWKIPKDIEPYSYKPKTEIKSIDADFEMTGW